MKIKKLAGYSGANIQLVSDNGNWFVRKIAQDIAQNSRLKTQCYKQHYWATLKECGIKVPMIIKEGEINGLYYFDMEYIHGLDGISFLQNANYSQLRDLVDKLLTYYLYVKNNKNIDDEISSQEIFQIYYKKIIRISNQFNGNIQNETIVKLLTKLDEWQYFEDSCSTINHGDCTFENIIVNNAGKVYFVDFLDPPFPHYWQDISKMFQDIDGGWYLRNNKIINRCTLSYIYDSLMNFINTYEPQYKHFHNFLLAVNFLRILPYTRTDEQFKFVLERVEKYSDS
jgi:aminoglycoside phosphotransferase